MTENHAQSKNNNQIGQGFWVNLIIKSYVLNKHHLYIVIGKTLTLKPV